MRPLVQATVFDATGPMRATFFNQPWLVDRYPSGTRLLLHGKADGRGRLPRLAPCPRGRPGGGGDRRRARGPSPTTPPARESPRRRSSRLVRAAAPSLADVPEPLAAAHAGARAPARPRGGAGGDALPALTRATSRRGRRRLAFEELLLSQLVLLRRRALRSGGRGGDRARAGGVAQRAVAATRPAVRAHRRSASSDRGDLRGPRPGPPDAEAADGRGGQRQDGRRAARDAASRRARARRRR